MNPVNEEDEPLPESSPSIHTATINVTATVFESAPITESTLEDTSIPFNQANEHLKLRTNIDTVFRSLPACEQLVNLDKDNRRLEALEQLLIDRLIMTSASDTFPNSPQPPITDPQQALKQPSSAAFSSNLAANYLSQNPQNNQVFQLQSTVTVSSTDKTKLELNGLQLTSECLRLFSRERLLQQADSKSDQSSLNSSFRSDYTAGMTTSNQLSLHASAKQVMS